MYVYVHTDICVYISIHMNIVTSSCIWALVYARVVVCVCCCLRVSFAVHAGVAHRSVTEASVDVSALF